MGDFAVPDPDAPVGTSDNPHVFNSGEKGDWQTFGAMHTNQDKEGWANKDSYNHAYTYTKTTNPYNKGAMGQKTEAVKGLDEAFNDPAVKPFEEWTLLSSTQDGYFFSGANGLPIPDGHGGTKLFQASMSNSMDDLDGLVGQEFVQTNFVSTSITVDYQFNSKPLRILFRMKPGQKGIYVSGNPGNYKVPGTKPANISYFASNEEEFILPSHQKLKVVGVQQSTSTKWKYDVIVEVVDQNL